MDLHVGPNPGITVLVLGANGQLGTEVVKADPNSVIGHYRRILSLDDAYFVLDGIKPDYVINCAAYTDTRKAQTKQGASESKLMNSYLPGVISKACANLGINLIHISSNYVIPDNVGECDEVLFNPDDSSSTYGTHKSEGEHMVMDYLPTAKIVRFGNLMGFNWKLPKLIEKLSEINVHPGVLIRPVSTTSTANFILSLIDNPRAGVHHYGSSDVITLEQYFKTLAVKFNKEIKINLASQNELSPIGSWLKVTTGLKTHDQHISEAMRLI